ncbi:hypothetical protein HERIO_2462 [Hepatospora eriocheir]|uniref:Uncharacterized protein n=1 Tax=Hepatospora eriocheir TaxID=1081669 RepID=A0A1X0Q6V6_9MICR|nr:hypothetical protein HERIO_2462 [Hepatospora eriocheir]
MNFKKIIMNFKENEHESLSELNELIDKNNAYKIAGVINRIIRSIEFNYNEEFTTRLTNINERLKGFLNKKYYFLLIDPKKIKFKSLKKNKPQGLLSSFSNLVIESLINKPKSEIRYKISEATDPKFSSKIIESSSDFIDLLGSYIFRTSSTKFYFGIALLLDESNIQQFMNLLVKMNFMDDDSLNEHAFNFINNIDCVFQYLQKYNPDVFNKMLDHIYSEKRYFKEIFICNLHNLDVNEILKYIRPYNFDVIGSLLENRPFIVVPLIDAFNENKLKVGRKFFITKIIEYDKYFVDFVDKINLESYEINDLKEKSELFKNKKLN